MKDGNDRNSTSDTSSETLVAERSSHVPVGSTCRGSATIKFDAREFFHFLEDTNWSEAQKTEYATLVWEIVCEFVAMGYALHPLQLAQESSGKLGPAGFLPSKSGAGVLDSKHQSLIREFISAGDASGSLAQKESR